MKKKLEISWYIKLNILIMGLLFVFLFMRQLNSHSFQIGLNSIFSSSSFQPNKRSAQIKIVSERSAVEKETTK